MDMKKTVHQKLLWIDLEMTGLNPAKDLIIEVAAVVTDWDFNHLAVFESGVGQKREVIEKLLKANPWAVARPAETKVEIELSVKSPASALVEAELVKLVDAHFAKDQPVLLAGNSIHADRGFIKNYWPNLEKRLHYRMLDVSAWKVVMQGKYGLEFKKTETHRALADIYESIDELKFYLKQGKF